MRALARSTVAVVLSGVGVFVGVSGPGLVFHAAVLVVRAVCWACSGLRFSRYSQFGLSSLYTNSLNAVDSALNNPQICSDPAGCT